MTASSVTTSAVLKDSCHLILSSLFSLLYLLKNIKNLPLSAFYRFG